MGNPNEVDRSERLERKQDKAEKQAEKEADTRQTAASEAQKATPDAVKAAPVAADFSGAVAELQNKLASLKSQPSLSGPQIAHGLAAADSQLQMVLAEARGAQPQVERIAAYLASAKKSVTDLAGTSPFLGSLGGSFDELTDKAKKTFGGGVSASANKATAE